MNWRPGTSVEHLRERAQLLAATRAFFYARDVLEVQTPLIATAGNPDFQLDSISVDLSAGGYATDSGWLNTSPEFAMKRLLAAGSGDIYQITPAFRAGERGRWHNPEFTLLEWYRLGFSQQALMDEVAQLLVTLAQQGLPVEYMTWADAWAGLNYSSVNVLRAALEAKNLHVPSGLSLSELQDLTFSLLIQPRLGADGLCFVYHYPAEQAALARLSPADASVAERFELFWQGVELANGFVELSDAAEQRQRFQKDNLTRQQNAKPVMPLDDLFLAALEHGLPSCAGVAVGLDRLFALLMGVSEIGSAISFDASRC